MRSFIVREGFTLTWYVRTAFLLFIWVWCNVATCDLGPSSTLSPLSLLHASHQNIEVLRPHQLASELALGLSRSSTSLVICNEPEAPEGALSNSFLAASAPHHRALEAALLQLEVVRQRIELGRPLLPPKREHQGRARSRTTGHLGRIEVNRITGPYMWGAAVKGRGRTSVENGVGGPAKGFGGSSSAATPRTKAPLSQSLPSPSSTVYELPSITLYPYINWGKSLGRMDKCVECPNGTLVDTQLVARLGTNVALTRCWGCRHEGLDGGGATCGACSNTKDRERLRNAVGAERAPTQSGAAPRTSKELCAEREREAAAAGLCAQSMQQSVPTEACARRYPRSLAVDHWVWGKTWAYVV